MLVVDCNKKQFEYDIHSIVKAFFPEESVKVISPETAEQKKQEFDLAPVITIKFGPLIDEISFEEKEFFWEHTEHMEQYKNGFKGFLYQTLCELTIKKLPWGNLTGIRPTKIAMGMLEAGKTEGEISEYLRETHFLSEEKIDLCIEIAQREKTLLESIHYRDGYSLYIGIPFCPTTCLYCSFTSYPICTYRNRVDEYLDCVIKEMEFVAHAYKGKILDTVYIGGGTPTTLEAPQLERLLSKLKELFDFSSVLEFTVEAGRADSITREKLEVLKRYNVERISVNPQTMKDETLKIIGRQHTVDQVVEAFL